jgi:hypothetical protein
MECKNSFKHTIDIMLYTVLYSSVERKEIMKLVDWGFIASLVIFLLIFPISNAYLAGAIDVLLAQIALIGSGFIQIPATLMGVYVVWRGVSYINTKEKVKIPKKSAKTKTQKYLEV